MLTYNMRRTALVLILAIAIASTQNTTNNSTDLTLRLSSEKQVSIEGGKSVTLTMKIDMKVNNETESLFITAESPYGDPFEQPFITVKSSDKFQLECNEEESDFIGICQIQGEELTMGRVFEIVLSCEVDCDLKVKAYISSQFKINLGESYQLKNNQKTPLITSFEMEIGKDENYTEFMIIAYPQSTEDVLEGTTIYANYGQSPKKPTSTNSMVKSQSVSGHRIGIFLSSGQLKPGYKLLFIIVLGPNVDLTLSTRVVNQNIYQLYIGEPVYDFTTAGENRIYIINLEDYEVEGKFDQSILLKFITYSGYPEVTVSMDEKFTQGKDIAKWQADRAHSVELTPEIRNQAGGGKKVHIKVETMWSTNFELEASVNRKPFIDLEAQITQLFHIKGSELKNLIFQDENSKVDLPKDGMVQYKISIQVPNEQINLMIRDCGNYKQGKVLDCIINNSSELADPKIASSFNQIQLKQSKYQTSVILTFNYNIPQKCESSNPSPSPTTNTTRYTCKFHLLLYNTNRAQTSLNMNIELTINKNTIKQWVREGHLERGTIMQGDINYYAFQLPSVEDVVRLEVYVTVVQGDVTLLVSRNNAYPSFQDLGKMDTDVEYSIWYSVAIDGDRLTPGYYYIGVYGISMTDYNIGVAIERAKRKPNATNTTDIPNDTPTALTEIRLQRGIVQTFTMGVGKSLSKFIFSPGKDKENCIVRITEVQGNVDFVVLDKLESRQVCDNKLLQASEEDQCEFQGVLGHSYGVTVTGNKDQVQVFSILYSTATECDVYPWNFPLQVSLDPNGSVCLKYRMYQLQDIHISLSLSPIQMLTLNIVVTLAFTDKNITMKEHDRVISKSELQLLCKKSNQDCTFVITVGYPVEGDGKGKQSASFLMAVENYRAENVLFSGIATKVTSDEISPTKANKFFFYVFEDKTNVDISILFTSQTQSKYQIATRVVKNEQFIRDLSESLYPKFDDKSPGIVCTNISESASISVLTISKDKLTVKNGELSIILISVFGIPPTGKTAADSLTYVYKIEINQGGDRLLLGDSRIGVVGKDTIYEYEIQLSKSETTGIQIRSVDGDDCAAAFLVDPFADFKTSTIDKSVTFNGETGFRNVLIKTNADSCSYQISYSSIATPIANIVASVPYIVSLDNEQVKFYSYYHTNKNSFYIIQMVSAGSSYIFAEAIQAGQDIRKVLQKSLFSYSYIGEINSDLEIENNSPRFCSDCYYIIAIKGRPSLRAQLTINPSDVPIFLKEQAPLRDRADSNETNIYQFYSKSNFVVSLTVLYGEINAYVKDRTGNVIAKSESIHDDEEIEVKAVSGGSETQRNNYFDYSIQYIIEVRTKVDSSYYIEIKKGDQKKIHKLYEGMPLTLSLQNTSATQLQFYNVYRDTTINILVEDLKYFEQEEQNSLKFEVTKQGESVLNKYNVSENSYNLQIKGMEGQYRIKIRSEMNTEVSIVFARKEFNHLQAGRSYFMDRESVFQLFGSGDSVMIEVFPCKDDVSVRASSNLSLLLSDSQDQTGIIRMEHGNFGGHYVLVAENLVGQFYIEVSQIAEQQPDFTYVITYHFFSKSKSESMPYRNYYINRLQINYKYYLGGVEFLLNRVRRKDQSVQNANVTYKLYISNNSAEVERMTKCSLGKVYTATKTSEVGGEMPSFKFDTDRIKEIVGNSESYLVGAQAVVQLQKKDSTAVRQLYFVYDLTQLVIDNQPLEKASFTFDNIQYIALWIVLPFVVGSVLLFFAARFLIRSYRQDYPMQLVEEDPQAGESQQVINNSQSQSQGQGRGQPNLEK